MTWAAILAMVEASAELTATGPPARMSTWARWFRWFPGSRFRWFRGSRAASSGR
jgi:hypothetical protein